MSFRTGAGKTFTIFQTARVHWMIYWECNRPLDQDLGESLLDDSVFSQMHSELESIKINSKKNTAAEYQKFHRQLVLEMVRIIRRYLLARLLFCYWVVNQDKTPEEYLKLQLYPEIQYQIMKLAESLKEVPPKLILLVSMFIIKNIENRISKKLLIGLDEAQVALIPTVPGLLSERAVEANIHWKQGKPNTDYRRGILSVLTKALALNRAQS